LIRFHIAKVGISIEFQQKSPLNFYCPFISAYMSLLVNSNIDIKRAWKRLLSIPQSEALAIAYHS